jgi:hypothetical protein
MFAHSTSNNQPSCVLAGMSVSVASTDESHPQLETDESYSLDIPSCQSNPNPIATAKAQTVYGALRALESFSQLVQVWLISFRWSLVWIPKHSCQCFHVNIVFAAIATTV